MDTSNIAQEIAGKSSAELRDAEFPGADSVDLLLQSRLDRPRQNVRFAIGKIVGVKDLNSKRRLLARRMKKLGLG